MRCGGEAKAPLPYSWAVSGSFLWLNLSMVQGKPGDIVVWKSCDSVFQSDFLITVKHSVDQEVEYGNLNDGEHSTSWIVTARGLILSRNRRISERV